MPKQRTTRKQKVSPPKEEAKQQQVVDEKMLKVDTLIKELPIDVQGEILNYLGAAYEVRKGKLMRKTLRMSGKIQEKLLHSIPQIMRGKQRVRLDLKTVPMKISNSINNTKSFYKFFDHPKFLGNRSLAVVVDSSGNNPYYRYSSNIEGLDSVEINTPMNNDTILERFIKRDYPSYPFTPKKLGKKQIIVDKFNPSNPSTGYNPPRRAYVQ